MQISHSSIISLHLLVLIEKRLDEIEAFYSFLIIRKTDALIISSWVLTFYEVSQFLPYIDFATFGVIDFE
jgi:hypothetical protein